MNLGRWRGPGAEKKSLPAAILRVGCLGSVCQGESGSGFPQRRESSVGREDRDLEICYI